MKPKRVECDKCQNFIEPVSEFVKDDNVIDSNIITKAKCKLGKRVMFRLPDMGFSGYPFDTGGYFRYCGDFKELEAS